MGCDRLKFGFSDILITIKYQAASKYFVHLQCIGARLLYLWFVSISADFWQSLLPRCTTLTPDTTALVAYSLFKCLMTRSCWWHQFFVIILFSLLFSLPIFLIMSPNMLMSHSNHSWVTAQNESFSPLCCVCDTPVFLPLSRTSASLSTQLIFTILLQAFISKTYPFYTIHIWHFLWIIWQ